MTAFDVSLPGKVLGAWKNAPTAEMHPIYMAISRGVQTALRRYIRSAYVQDIDQYKELPVIYPLLVYSALPPMNKVKLTSDGLLKFTEDELYWDSTNMELRKAIFEQFSGPRLRDIILPDVQSLLTDMPNTRQEYEKNDIGKMLSLKPEVPAELNFKSLIFQEREIIEGIVESGIKFRKFLEAEEIEEAIQELAEFGASLTDAFNENISSIYKGAPLRPLGTLLLLEVAKILDPNLGSSIKPFSILDLYCLAPGSSFSKDSFFNGDRPGASDLAIHQSIVSVEDSGI